MAIENLEFRINAAIDAGNSAKTLGELKTSLKDLRDLAAQAGPENVEQFNKLTTAAGEVNDKIKDVRESVQALSGTPMERLTNSFSRLKQSIFEMDLEKFKLSLIGIKDSFMALGAQALSPFKALGSAMAGLVAGTTSLTAAMRALGGAIAATGIGALVVAVGLLVAYWDQLKEAGGIIGNTFKFVSDTINSATSALAGFARQLGLIGPEQKDEKKEAEDRKKRAEDLTKSVQAEVDAYDKLYENTKKLREANRKEVGRTEEETQRLREKYRVEDLEAELEYRKKRGDIIRKGAEAEIKLQIEINKRRRAETLKSATEMQKDLEFVEKFTGAGGTLMLETERISYLATGKMTENIKRLKDIVAKYNLEGTSIGMEFSIVDIRKIYGELEKEIDAADRQVNDLFTKIQQQETALSDYEKNVKPDLVLQGATDIIRLENDLADARQEIQNNARKRQKDAEKNRKVETKKSEMQFLMEYFQTEEDFLNERLKLQEKWNRSSEEIDEMYREIAKEGELEKSKDIFAEIDKRIQYQSDANQRAFEQEQAANAQMAQNRATQFDLENLMISRKDVFSDEFNYRVQIDDMYAEIAADNASWTSEQIYAEIQQRLQWQIDAYDAEKQANIDKTNAIIQTAQYASQALDGFNNFLYTMDENRRISGEMSEKDMALRAFKRNKAFGIVNAAINTAAGVTAVLASPTNKIDPTGTLQAIQIGFVIATGLAQIAAIAAQKFDPSSYNNASGNVGTTPTTAETTVSTGQFMNVGEFKPGDTRERRVYVVESDITGVQRKVQVIQERSKF